VNVFQHLKFEDAEAIAEVAIEEYTKEKVDAVYLIYNEFKSVIRQRIVAEKLLPIPRADLNEADVAARVDYLYEPSPAELFARMLPGHVRVQVWRALLESAAAENAARMTAMDAATKNATDMIDSLTLYMNKVRQAGITREIIEVVSGAQAL
jgi:F-type H+-transporting ATPase subunit gamma